MQKWSFEKTGSELLTGKFYWKMPPYFVKLPLIVRKTPRNRSDDWKLTDFIFQLHRKGIFHLHVRLLLGKTAVNTVLCMLFWLRFGRTFSGWKLAEEVGFLLESSVFIGSMKEYCHLLLSCLKLRHFCRNYGFFICLVLIQRRWILLF